ncbi:hemerythrin domain-containing protein [Massilia sp. TSP1-1-2]|uniref:hemerythrin domain-containing protein n=1 Tax=Massilia sp. TSP1-1-2 TaxID=2804649 RepID=UPI003CEA15EF
MDTLGNYLTHDHARCDALLRRTQQSVGAACWPDAQENMAVFQHGLERHLLIEEQILYPAFELALGRAVALTATMRTEHLRIRAVAQRLADAVAAFSASAFVKHAEALLLTLHQHSEKEEGVLYPMMERVLARRGPDLLEAARAFGAGEQVRAIAR